MKKSFCLMVFCLLVVLSSVAFASGGSVRKLIDKIEIKSLDAPTLSATVDESASIGRTKNVRVDSIVWYKNGSPMQGKVIDEVGMYMCRMYLTVDQGYMLSNDTDIDHSFDSKKVKIEYAEMNNIPFINIYFDVKESVVAYPKAIRISGIADPRLGALPSMNAYSNNSFYEVDRVEWYRGSLLMESDERFEQGVYKCRVYVKLLNGFSIKAGVIGYIAGEEAVMVVNSKEVYIEREYDVLPGEDERMVEVCKIDFKEMPHFGLEVNKVGPFVEKRELYYAIDEVVWYRDDSLMHQEYFNVGTYKCRIYLRFANGGYPASPLKAYVGDSIMPRNASSTTTGRYYVERIFNVDEPKISLFEFYDLILPEYGGIQDNKLKSVANAMYSPSVVSWYKDGKYMSNVDVFKEGVYTCRFTLNVNSECIVKDNVKATINGLFARVLRNNNIFTVEMYYEIKKPSIKWTNASTWASKELEAALNKALIPSILENKDYTDSITRAEFAAVAVRLYERLDYRLATPVFDNPFVDTDDVEVLKAYALGITNGTSETTFEPESLITRQEMATMMVRALAKAGIRTSVDLNKVSKFLDHGLIDSWALDGVYYMSSVGIIKGVGNNTFDVHGKATREEALAISIRSIERFNFGE